MTDTTRHLSDEQVRELPRWVAIKVDLYGSDTTMTEATESICDELLARRAVVKERDEMRDDWRHCCVEERQAKADLAAATEREGRMREALVLADEAVRRASWFVVGHSWPEPFMSECMAAERAFDRYKAARSVLSENDQSQSDQKKSEGEPK